MISRQSDRMIEDKIERLRAGGSPRVVDLFSGCGGISLGFKRAGCAILAGIDVDAAASRSHALNFHRNSDPACLGRHGQPRDLAIERPGDTAAWLGFSPADVDLVIGGPPCQAYARIGRAKLRSVARRADAFLRDARAGLYGVFLDHVSAYRPIGVLIENVPDILNHGGTNILELIAETLEGLGYRVCYAMLNAASYGVPQWRERVFLIALHNELGATPGFPAASHRVELPHGYRGVHAVAHAATMPLLARSRLVDADRGGIELTPSVSASQAVGDLPPIREHLGGGLKRGARKFDQLVPYAPGRPSGFAREMRKWPGFGAGDGVLDHVTRILPRDVPIFKVMSAGDEYPAAHRKACLLFGETVDRLRRAGQSLSRGDLDDLRRRMVPPYPVETFPNRWWKLHADQPVRTLTAHISKDTYSHIHYDSTQARTISVREAARLQSFPDGFVFAGGMNAAFRQIGNAVPPLVAWRLAETMVADIHVAAKSSSIAAAE